MERICDELEALEIYNTEDKPFVTYDALKDFLTRTRIQEIFSTLARDGTIQVYQQQEIVDAVSSNGLRLFATLLSFSRPGLIAAFIENDHFKHNELDSKLPLNKPSLATILIEESLCKIRQKFLPPIFRADQSHRKLEDGTRLPFVKCRELGEGGFGEVHEMTLPASCQALVPQNGGEVVVVRKTIKATGSKSREFEFDRERHILSLLRCLRHPNIIQLFTAYTIHGRHNFLFPLAEGSVKDLLSNEHRPVGFESDNQFFQALFQVASAVERVHNYFWEDFDLHQIGCHLDLKPDNILFQSGTFILSDFGLSRMVPEHQTSRSLYRHGGGEYSAPECVSMNEDFKTLSVGRSSDIWSFGCILSEILTYIKFGLSGVVAFSKKRRIVFAGYWTCEAFHAGDKPHQDVLKHLDCLDGEPHISAQVEVMTLIRELLEIEPSRRPKAKRVTAGLFHAAQHELFCSIKSQFLPLTVSHLKYKLRELSRSKTFAELKFVHECLVRVGHELKNLSSLIATKESRAVRLAYHIQRAVDSLWDTQSSEMRVRMDRALENRLLSTEDSARLTALMSLDDLSAEKEEDQVAIASQPASKRIGLLATVKQVAFGFQGAAVSSIDGKMQMEKHDIQMPLTKFHWHFIGSYRTSKSSQILIERLTYDKAWYGRTQELLERVQDIAHSRAIPTATQTFPILKCSGFFHDIPTHSFNMVYDFPTKPPPSSPAPPLAFEKVISLWDIFLKVRSRQERPSLDVVFALAAQLCTIVLTMHKAGWLHKSVSSYNIIFFPDRFSTIADAMAAPYFIGFNYSRLNWETAFTQGPTDQLNNVLEYQHPVYLQGRHRFCQEFEYYSVGLILLELAYWCPLANITGNIRGRPEELAESLAQTHVPIVGTYMGRSYAEAVGSCLKGDFGDGENPGQVRDAFDQRVLQKIERMVSKA